MSEVLRRYLDRLHQSARRSGLLSAFPTRTIRRLDIAKLEIVSPVLPTELIEKLIKSENGKVQFDLELNSQDEKPSGPHHFQLRGGWTRFASSSLY